MRLPNYFILGFMILSVWACQTKPTTVQPPDEPGRRLFDEAERLFESQSYAQAMKRYIDYHNQFPDSPLAPAALMKIGTIYSVEGNYESARETFDRIIIDYPESDFVQDSLIGTLSSYYVSGQYDQAITYSEVIDDKTVANEFIVRKYAIVGDAWMVKKNYAEAAFAYSQAYLKASDIERKSLFEKLQTSVNHLDPDTIQSLLIAIDDRIIQGTSKTNEKLLKGYLVYRLGINLSETGRYEDAIKALSRFIQEQPDHQDIEKTEQLIEELKSKAAFNRYTIGCLLPLSGRYGVYGNQALKGIELALLEFTSLNQYPPIKLTVKDTESSPKKANQAINELANEKVAAIIGPIAKAEAEAAAQAAQNYEIPIITLTQKEQIADNREYVFRNFLTPEMQVRTLVNYASKDLHLRSFAVLYPQEKYGETLLNMFWDEVLLHDGNILGAESYSPDTVDFATSIKKLVGLYYKIPEDLKSEEKEKYKNITGEDPSEENADKDKDDEEPKPIVDFEAIFIPDGPEKVGLILPQLAYYEINNVYLLGTNLWHSDHLLEMAPKYSQEAIMPEVFFSDSTSQVVQQFVQNFSDTYDKKPGFIEAVSYDSAMILFDTISRSQIQSRKSIVDELHNLNEFQGVTGPTSFDKNGEAQKKLFLLKVSGNMFTEIEYE